MPLRLHLGHLGTSWDATFRTKKLNIFLHLAQAYSYMGMKLG